jgi:tripeptidyl-peptidase I
VHGRRFFPPQRQIIKKIVMILLVFILVSSLLCSCVAEVPSKKTFVAIAERSRSQNSDSHVFMESIPHHRNRDIQKIKRMTSDVIHEVIFAIHQRNMAELTKILEDVSDPASENYGRHMTNEEVVSLTSNPEGRDAVVTHLISSGAVIVSETLNGEFVTANAPISVWERLFNTEFFLFHQLKSDSTTKEVVRAESYSLPISLQHYVDGVYNTIQMPLPHPDNLMSRKPFRIEMSPGSYYYNTMNPQKIRDYYNVSDAKGSINSTQALFSSRFYFSPSDLSQFQHQWGLPSQPVANFVGEHVSDSICAADTSMCEEPNLDVEYIMASSPYSPTTFWDVPLSQGWADWLLLVANTPDPPLVFSISYASYEEEVSTFEKNAFNTAAIKLSVRGVTLVASSGDDGAVAIRNCKYTPLFPASNPYVTAVGGTMVSQSSTIQSDEISFV